MTRDASYTEALRVFRDLCDGDILAEGLKNEYVRGGVNLIADLFGVVGQPVDERMDDVLADLRAPTPNPHLEVIRNALTAYGNAPALMHLAELEAEITPAAPGTGPDAVESELSNLRSEIDELRRDLDRLQTDFDTHDHD